MSTVVFEIMVFKNLLNFIGAKCGDQWSWNFWRDKKGPISSKLPSVTKALFRPPDSIRQSESCLRRHKQQLFASLPCLVWFASLELGTRNAVLSRLPEVSVQQCTGLGGCSADNALCSAIFQCYTYNMWNFDHLIQWNFYNFIYEFVSLCLTIF